MSWIAITDLEKPAFNIRGIGIGKNVPGARPPAVPGEVLPVGTLMIELKSSAGPDEPQPILFFRRNSGWVRKIDVRLDASGQLVLLFRQGTARSRVRLALPALLQGGRIRITYSWDAPHHTGRLTAELPDEGKLYQTHLADPVPLPVEDVKVLIRNGGATRISPDVSFVAVSDEIEPVGFGIGLAKGTPVETPAGPVPVERLRLGDEVLTATAGVRPLRWIGRRTLPALGGFQPVRLRAPFLGLTRDITLAPAHRLRFEMAEAEYMLGEDEVLISAAHLVNGKHARHESSKRLVTYYQLLLDVHDCLLHDGIWAESLFVGTIRRRPALARSTVLGDMPASAIPEQRAFSPHRLTGYEARSLAAAFRA